MVRKKNKNDLKYTLSMHLLVQKLLQGISKRKTPPPSSPPPPPPPPRYRMTPNTPINIRHIDDDIADPLFKVNRIGDNVIGGSVAAMVVGTVVGAALCWASVGIGVAGSGVAPFARTLMASGFKPYADVVVASGNVGTVCNAVIIPSAVFEFPGLGVFT